MSCLVHCTPGIGEHAEQAFSGLSTVCARIGELWNRVKQQDKRESSRGDRKLNTRRSFHRPSRPCDETSSLLNIAADAVWKNLDQLSQASLNTLPVDLAELLLDKLVFAGKLNEASLAKLSPHRLSRLQLSGIPEVTNAWLALSKGFALQSLSAVNCVQLGNEALQCLRHQHALRNLDLSGCTGFTNDGLEYLSGLNKLQELSLGGCEGLTGDGLSHLHGLVAVTLLDLNRWQDLSTLRPLQGMTRMRNLNLGWCSSLHDDAILRTVSRFRQLQELHLSLCKITDAGLMVLQYCSNLTLLDLQNCAGLTNACISHITALKHLQWLSLEKVCQLTDSGLRQLDKLTLLQHLNLGFTGVTHVALLRFTTLISLRTLILDSCHAVQDEIMPLIPHLPLLEKLDLSDTLVTNAGLVYLEPLRHIRDVSLSYAGGPQSISDMGTAHLAKLVSLQALQLDMRSIGDGCMANLSGLSDLRHLDLFGAKISDAGCGWLKHLTALEFLQICGGAVTDHGVAHMAPLMALRHLNLSQNTRITDSSLLTLSSLTSLTFLNLNQSKLTGNGIQHLHNLAKLEVLILTSTRVRRPAADRLQAVLPNIQQLEC